MTQLDRIITEAKDIRDSSAAGYDHADRKLAGMVADLAGMLSDAQATIDDLVSTDLDAAGIDMQPAYARLRALVAAHRKAAGTEGAAPATLPHDSDHAGTSQGAEAGTRERAGEADGR